MNFKQFTEEFEYDDPDDKYEYEGGGSADYFWLNPRGKMYWVGDFMHSDWATWKYSDEEPERWQKGKESEWPTDMQVFGWLYGKGYVRGVEEADRLYLTYTRINRIQKKALKDYSMEYNLTIVDDNLPKGISKIADFRRRQDLV